MRALSSPPGLLAFRLVFGLAIVFSGGALPATERSARGLLALYEFSDGEGERIRDTSGLPGLDLRIEQTAAVRWSPDGLEVRKPVKIQSLKSAKRLAAALARSGELTLEVWITPANDSQSGPARIVTISSDASNRNLTLGQDNHRYDVRLRSSKTSNNGLPSLPSPSQSVQERQQVQVVFTRNRQGQTRLYQNGELVAQGEAAGSLAKWSQDYSLLLADEAGGGRPWLGTFHLVALYQHSLTPMQVAEHFRLGPRAPTAPRRPQPASDFFVTRVAPLLTAHCAECHDAANRQGGLELTRQAPALAGGDSGPAIEPGKASESLLYQLIESDDMPLNRTPLTAAEKQVLRKWIDSGAKWTMDFVDPALFVHGQQGNSTVYVQRLTRDEYIGTVRATLGVDIEQAAREQLPSDLRADGFSNTAYNLNVDLKHVEAYAQLASEIVEQIDARQFAQRFSKSRKFTDKDMGALIESMGRWVLRGPLSEEEVIVYRGIATTVASSGGTFEEAVKYLLEAMLQSPRFLYRVENQRGDGSRWPVSEFELANRLSYVLWGCSPDERLFRLAENGDLMLPEVFEEEVERMLDDPHFADRADQFITQWLNLDGLRNLQPNAEHFPEWDARLAEAMQQETRAFFRHVAIDKARPMTDLLTAQLTFATPELAEHYRLRGTPTGRSMAGLQQYDLHADPARGGLLTQGSVLTIGGDEASTVTRGLFVLHNLLRGVVQDPPPCVDTTPVATEPGLTQRMIATGRIQNEACGGCHSRFEPLAFGLEKFDGLGTYLETDQHGNRLREDGQVRFPGQVEAADFETSQELMEILATSDRVKQSLSWKVIQFALGRPLTAADANLVDQVHAQALEDGGTYRSLMKALVNSELIRSGQTIDIESEQSQKGK